MTLFNRREPMLLLAGDILFFLVSLWLTLLLRNVAPPSGTLFLTHLLPFSILFVAWVVVFYIAGLYEKHTTILKSKLPNILATAQITNSGIAVIFFYFVPFFLITPKTVLFIYLLVSFILILFWRTYGYFVVSHKHPDNAILIGSGDEVKELLNEVNNNPIYNLHFVSSVDLNRSDKNGFWDEIVDRVYSEDVSVIAIDLAHENVEPVLPHLYNLIFSNIDFIDMHKVYEDIFDRVPLSLLRYNWFLENISSTPRTAYDAVKRLMDIFVSFILSLVSLVLYPFVILAIKLDDRGPIFITQERVGQNGKKISLYKFRSMSRNLIDLQSREENKVTRVGNFLRKTRVDELPQLLNVLKGDISLIGPRPELPSGVTVYDKEIPYYNVRHLIKPGLSGWAQIHQENHPHHGAEVNLTREKLTYDIYYLKNRSLWLDLKIALQTVKTLLSRSGI